MLECDMYDWIQDVCQKMSEKKFKISHFRKYFRSTCLILEENPHDLYHLAQRHPLSQNHMISAWFVE